MEAAAAVLQFTQDVEFDQYRTDLMMRSAVERQLEIVGEALHRLSREDPDVAARVPEVPDVVGMRNVLIHGYDVVDHHIVWRTTREDLPRLVQVVAALLAELDAAAGDTSTVP